MQALPMALLASAATKGLTRRLLWLLRAARRIYVAKQARRIAVEEERLTQPARDLSCEKPVLIAAAPIHFTSQF
jgi:hypothetical protein